DEIKMFRWTGTEWSRLDTNKKTKDATYSYYEARTYGFSHFAISGQKPEPQSAAVKQVSSSGSKDQDNTGLLLLLIVALALAGFAFRKRIKNITIPKIGIPSIRIPKIFIPAVIAPQQPDQPARHDIKISSAFGYKGATILHKLKIENISSAPVADIKVSLFVPNVFLLMEKEKSIALLKAKESKTVTFEIRPTGECGDCQVSGKVNYYDTANNKTKEIDIDSKMLSIICPMLKVKEISEPDWHSMVSNLLQTEENTKEIDMPAETLFTMVSRIIKDMHMHMLTPEVSESPQLFNGVARFCGEGIKGLKYAAQAEVVGGARKAKLILRAWAEKEDALTGFYHGILDEIEKRINVKGYIDEPIVQHFNIAGHYVTGEVGKIVEVGDRSIIQREGRAEH
ncbi:MAG: PGF-pre-PGF domain-containing protein, partial [Candidatus Methanoperedens sp.]|nr:PGF-pre-PGF domain-containing protein [Candidatus Methanoperedens sp.]